MLLSSTEEEYKRLSECLADEGSYNAVAFKYTADYYDPSQPTEEEEASKQPGETLASSAPEKEMNAGQPDSSRTEVTLRRSCCSTKLSVSVSSDGSDGLCGGPS